MSDRHLPKPPRRARATLTVVLWRAVLVVVGFAVTGFLVRQFATNAQFVGLQSSKVLAERGRITTGRIVAHDYVPATLRYSFEFDGKVLRGEQRVAAANPWAFDAKTNRSLADRPLLPKPGERRFVHYRKSDPSENYVHDGGGDRSGIDWTFTEGNVIAVEEDRWVRAYEFDVDGKTFRASHSWLAAPSPGTWPPVGATIDVRYDPDDPTDSQDAVAEPHMTLRFEPSGLVVVLPVLLVFLALLVPLQWTLSQRKRLFATGREGRGTILSVEPAPWHWFGLLSIVTSIASAGRMPALAQRAVRYGFVVDSVRHERTIHLTIAAAAKYTNGDRVVVLLPADRIEGHRLLDEVRSWVVVPRDATAVAEA